MTIPYCVQIGDPMTAERSLSVEKLILATFAEVDQIYNNWNPNSEVAALNHLPAHQIIELSEPLTHFLHLVADMVQKTEGRFDPTVAPLQLLWKERLREGVLPEPHELDPLIQAAGWKHIHLEDNLLWKDESLTAIDLGGVAKGYAVDLIAARLAHLGYCHIYVEWGGEIRTIGSHPSRRPWKIGIHGLSYVELSDASIATSGSYIQNWKVQGECYTHIIDPSTWSPLHDSPISSVSVIASSCAIADALATALMLFPSKEAAETWAALRGIQVCIW